MAKRKRIPSNDDLELIDVPSVTGETLHEWTERRRGQVGPTEGPEPV